MEYTCELYKIYYNSHGHRLIELNGGSILRLPYRVNVGHVGNYITLSFNQGKYRQYTRMKANGATYYIYKFIERVANECLLVDHKRPSSYFMGIRYYKGEPLPALMKVLYRGGHDYLHTYDLDNDKWIRRLKLYPGNELLQIRIIQKRIYDEYIKLYNLTWLDHDIENIIVDAGDTYA